jgi:hypothetical protein
MTRGNNDYSRTFRNCLVMAIVPQKHSEKKVSSNHWGIFGTFLFALVEELCDIRGV